MYQYGETSHLSQLHHGTYRCLKIQNTHTLDHCHLENNITYSRPRAMVKDRCTFSTASTLTPWNLIWIFCQWPNIIFKILSCNNMISFMPMGVVLRCCLSYLQKHSGNIINLLYLLVQSFFWSQVHKLISMFVLSAISIAMYMHYAISMDIIILSNMAAVQIKTNLVVFTRTQMLHLM